MSLIAMHSAAAAGFVIPPARKKWHYTKGGEKNFKNTNDDVRAIISLNGLEIAATGFDLNSDGKSLIATPYGLVPVNMKDESLSIVAMRMPISSTESDEQDLNECIGAPESDKKVIEGGLVMSLSGACKFTTEKLKIRIAPGGVTEIITHSDNQANAHRISMKLHSLIADIEDLK